MKSGKKDNETDDLLCVQIAHKSWSFVRDSPGNHIAVLAFLLDALAISMARVQSELVTTKPDFQARCENNYFESNEMIMNTIVGPSDAQF